MFRLTTEPIEAHQHSAPDAGGFVSFEGKVRDNSEGRQVLALEYEAYPELAQTEGENLLAEATERFGLIQATLIHRVGMLKIGDIAVRIDVAAAHRREAFGGCEWIIDQLKIRVPIWKRETYADGDSGWVGADVLAPDNRFSDSYFARQVTLPEIGDAGQERLLDAKVLLVGVGGLGSASLPYLVGAGVGTLGLVDPDIVDVSNLHRQTIYQAGDTGRGKVDRAAAFAKKLRPGVRIDTFAERLGPDNVERFVAAYDWIVDGTDSLDVKFILNATCRKLGKPFITASVHRFEGHIMTVMPDGPCLNCLFPERPSAHCVGTCAENGVLGVVPGMLGLLSANEVLKGILGYGEVLAQDMLLVDLRSGETTRVSRAKRDGCRGCAGVLSANDDLEVANLAQAESRLGPFTVVDVRELDESPRLEIEHVSMPSSSFSPDLPAGPVVLVCSHGVRSHRLTASLRLQGRQDVWSLAGGVTAMNQGAGTGH